MRNTLFILISLLLSALPVSAQEHSWEGIHETPLSRLESQFQTPPTEYANHVIWGIGGNLTHKDICADLDSIYQRGFRSVILEAGYHLPFDYLSEGWFKMVADIAREVKRRGMKMWIIDEGKYPSGFAGGKFTKERPDLRMQALVVLDRRQVAAGEVISKESVDSRVLSAVAVCQDAGVADREVPVENHAISFNAGLHRWEILLVGADYRTGQTRAVNNPTGGKDTKNSQMDYLNPKAVRQFIDWTHEQYKRYIGKYFGTTMLGFRGDEPDYAYVPYTPAITDSFIHRKGYDPRPHMASIFSPSPSLKDRQFRADYWDVWSRMFAQSFFKQQADWCKANGVAHVTHLNKDHFMPDCVRAEGDLFRDLSQIQIPGIDAIWNQIWPDTVNDFPKYASSVAHVYGKPRAFSESFAAYYSVPTMKDARYVVDYQMVRGINFFEFMFWPAKSKKQGWMSSPGMKDLNAYTNRATYLLSQGRPGARVAVYYPVSTLWLGNTEVDGQIKRISHLLLEHQQDFDYVTDDAFHNGLTLQQGALVSKSGQHYTTLVVPSSEVISAEAERVINAFVKGGGRLLLWGEQPDKVSDKTFTKMEDIDLPEEVWVEPTSEWTGTVAKAMPEPELAVKNLAPLDIDSHKLRPGERRRKPIDPTIDLRYQRRELPDGSLYFIFNEGHRQQHCLLGMDRVGHLQQWIAETGEVRQLPDSAAEGRSWAEITLDPQQSIFLVVRNSTDRLDAREAGAVGDGKTNDTRALQAAIDRLGSKGGGTLVLSRGTYLSGALFFRPGVNLHLEKDATLLSSTDDKDFAPIPTRFEGIEQVWKPALVNFIDCKNVRIDGEGTVDGQGVTWKKHGWGNYGRPRMFCFTRCDGGKVSGLRLRDQASWCLHVLYTDNFDINGVDIRAEHTIPSSDGIDIDSSRGIHVSNCYIEDNDDCISIKSGKDDDGRRVAMPSEDILVENCTFGYGHSGVDIGSEVSGDVRNVTVRHCKMLAGNSGCVRVKSQPSRGGVIENINFEDLEIQDVTTVFDIIMNWRLKGKLAPDAPTLTQIRNFNVSGINGTAKSMGRIMGDVRAPLSGIKIQNCNIQAPDALKVQNAKVQADGLKIEEM